MDTFKRFSFSKYSQYKAGAPKLWLYIVGCVIASIAVGVFYEKGKVWCREKAEKREQSE